MKKQFKIAILGMGYVGLPLAVEFGKKYQTVGFDINTNKINDLNNFYDSNNEISKINIKKSLKLKFSSNINDLKHYNFYIICVPTPILKSKKPDLSILRKAAALVSLVIKNKDFVVFESTVYPGVTEKICKNIIEKKSNLKLISNKNNEIGFYCGYSPERLNPGDKKRKLKDITKIISGSNFYATKVINKIYSSVLKNNTFIVNSIKVAEAAKVIENVQRDVNIALINEFAKIFNRTNLDIFEVLKASSTKWNFHRYSPGLVGGHCIGVDPYYLSYYSKQNKIHPLMITSGRKINDEMYKYIINKLITHSKKKNILLNKSKLLIMGYSFKENCSDIRNTQVKKIFVNLKNKLELIHIYDPVIKITDLELNIKKNIIKHPKNNYYDIILICVGHNAFNDLGKNKIKKFAKKENYLVFDLKNFYNDKEFIHI